MTRDRVGRAGCIASRRAPMRGAQARNFKP